MSVPYLVTGATGSLGASILKHLLSLVPASSIVASSTRLSARPHIEALGVEFRHVDFNDRNKLIEAFSGIENLFFVSTNTFDVEKRVKQHQNVIEAAKEVGVKHIWYSSLAFGGYGDSKIDVQSAHLVTERMLKQSGVKYTSVREGVYTEAFPLFLNWYPSEPDRVLYLPSDGAIAWTSRDELGEATAKLMVLGGHENEIALLTAGTTYTLTDIVNVINETTGRNVSIQWVSEGDYVRLNAINDEGKKPETFFRAWATVYLGVTAGDAETVSPLMKELLGREPKDAKEVITRLLAEDKNYTWHQNYAKVA